MPLWFVVMLISYGVIAFGVFYLGVLMYAIPMSRADKRRGARFILLGIVWPLLLIPWIRLELLELLALAQE